MEVHAHRKFALHKNVYFYGYFNFMQNSESVNYEHKWSSQWHNFGAFLLMLLFCCKKPFKMKQKIL